MINGRQMRYLQRGVIFYGALLACGTVQAHPHSFISLQATPTVEQGQLTGFKMRWTMDELTSADLLYDAGDAKPGSEIWKKLAAEVMANVIGQHYFSELWHNGQRVKFSATPEDYALGRVGHQAVLTFTLPLAHAQPLQGQRYQLATFDPSYYVDMQYDTQRAFALPSTLTHCNVSLQQATPSEDTRLFAQSLDKSDAPDEDLELGKQFAQQITLQCP